MYFIGLMSGTSTDAVDGVLADSKLNIIASCSQDINPGLRKQLLELNKPGTNELHKASIAAINLTDIYAAVVLELLRLSGLKPQDIQAIGAHGQTIRHAPELGYTIQLNAPAYLVEKTGIAVVADFRSRDIAAGGQGAPLVPAFHAALFGQNKAVLNLGGIANLTILDQQISGFDTGPANMLMDAWAQHILGVSFDKNGQWAASGTTQTDFVDVMLNEPWFGLKPPKSTGRDLFNLDWLQKQINAFGKPLDSADIQASLMSLSITSIKNAVNEYANKAQEIIVCGGGANNPVFMRGLEKSLTQKITTSADYNVPTQYVEALAFAWLAMANLNGTTACLPSVTGAKHPSIAGCIYPV